MHALTYVLSIFSKAFIFVLCTVLSTAICKSAHKKRSEFIYVYVYKHTLNVFKENSICCIVQVS